MHYFYENMFKGKIFIGNFSNYSEVVINNNY